MTEPSLDAITIGRCSVDLYGEQIGGRLEDVLSFRKAVGGPPANMAIGLARLGLKAGLISRVGDEQMGRFIREQLAREGVDVTGVRTDPARLTALVLLGVRSDAEFPMIFVRENCADWALDESDIEEAHVASARAVVVTGTHFARANTAAAQMKAMRVARTRGRRVALDIDYRPNLWGLAGHAAGGERYIASDAVTERLQSALPGCDLLVGTEEEIHIAGGSTDTLAALRSVRSLTTAMIVLKRGPMGCVAFPGPIPARIEDGIAGPGFPVEVYNVLGAGDAFMAGFLSGWLADAPVEHCCRVANACGAIAVSRLMCSSEYPTRAELDHFLAHGVCEPALRKDRALARVHHAATLRPAPDSLAILSVDHRVDQLGEIIPDGLRDAPARLARFKILAVEAALEVCAGRPGYGMFLDGSLGRQALIRAEANGLWLARQFPHGDPESLAANPAEWPVAQVVKVVADARPAAAVPLAARLPELRQIAGVCRAQGRALLIEALAADADRTSKLMADLYAQGLEPDWWLLEAQRSAGAWRTCTAAIERHDPVCSGIIVIARGRDFGEDLARAAGEPKVRGIVGGRALFGQVLGEWSRGRSSDEEARRALAAAFAAMGGAWMRLKGERAP